MTVLIALLALAIVATVLRVFAYSPATGNARRAFPGSALIGRFLPSKLAGGFGRRPFHFQSAPRFAASAGGGALTAPINVARPAASSRSVDGDDATEDAVQNPADGFEGLPPFGLSARRRVGDGVDVDLVSHAQNASERDIEACSKNHGMRFKR